MRRGQVEPDLDPKDFTIRTVPKRVAKVGDLLAGLLTATPDVPAAVEKLPTPLGLPRNPP